MKFSIRSGSPEQQRSACVIVGVFEKRRLSMAGQHLDEASGGLLTEMLRRGDMDGKPGQTLLLHAVPDVAAERVLLMGCGHERELVDSRFRTVVRKAATTLNETGAVEAVSYLAELPVKGRSQHWKLRQEVESAAQALYRFEQFKSKPETTYRPLRRMTLMVTDRQALAAGRRALAEGVAIAAGKELAQDLGNTPPNVCTPAWLARQAAALAKGQASITHKVMKEKDMEKMGMGALLSVARGSRQPAKFIILEYKGAKKGDRPVVLVGKGVTFDSGGISIKPSAAMDEMKYDMCGAASVLGVFRALGELRLPLNVVGLIPATENLPDGDASKPGDIVTSLSGQTIEILNTDAEGRLILCDALTYAERYRPEVIIDIATLTGACIIALGHQASAVLGNHSPLVHDLIRAGNESGDRAWELPLWEEYQEQLKSNFADMANIGGRPAGTITAACFLSRFTEKQHWAHLDIAGTAWQSGEKKNATGRPVALLTQYLLDRAAQ